MGTDPQLIQQLKQNEGIDLLDVPENQQEDLAMAFSHQMVNTSFFNFGKSQASSESQQQRPENPLILANNASSSEGALEQQQNVQVMMNIERKPSIQKSHSDQPQPQLVQNNRQEEVVQNMPKPSVQKNSSQPDLIEADFYKMSSPERSQSVPQDLINVSPEKVQQNYYNTHGMGYRNGPQNFNMNPQLQQQMMNQQMFFGSMPASGMNFQNRGGQMQFGGQQQGHMGNMNMNMNMMYQQQSQMQQMPFGGQQQQQGGGFNQNYGNMGVNANNPFGGQGQPQPQNNQQRSPSFPQQQQQQNVNIQNQPQPQVQQPQPQINVNPVPSKQQPQDQLHQIQPNLSESIAVPQKLQDKNQQQQQVQVEEQKEKVVDELDLLFNQPKPAPVQQEESKQEFEVMKTGDFGGWDELFNIGNNANAQKFIEQENERKRLEEEARQKKAQNISLVDTSINTSNLKKFFLQEISKSKRKISEFFIDKSF